MEFVVTDVSESGDNWSQITKDAFLLCLSVPRLASVTGFGNEMNARKCLVLGLALTLAACAATGPRYSEHIATLADVQPQTTRLTVFRTTESTQYSSRSVTVRIDGRVRGSCDFAGFLGAMIGAIGDPVAGAGAPFAVMGAESSGKECGGAFSIVEVDESIALRKLKDLRKSR